MHYVRRYALHDIRRYALHHMRHNALLGIKRGVWKKGSRNVVIYAANGSLIERAHMVLNADGRILPNKKGMSRRRRDVAFVLAERDLRDEPTFL